MIHSGKEISIDTKTLNQGTTGVLQAPKITINGFTLDAQRPASPRTLRFFASCGSRVDYIGTDVKLTGGCIEKEKLEAFKIERAGGSFKFNHDSSLANTLKKCQIKKDNGNLPSIELAFRRAVSAKKLDVIQELLPHVNINDPGPESGKTALHIAAAGGDLDIITLLLNNKANKDLLDKESNAAEDYIVQKHPNREVLVTQLSTKNSKASRSTERKDLDDSFEKLNLNKRPSP